MEIESELDSDEISDVEDEYRMQWIKIVLNMTISYVSNTKKRNKERGK